MRTHPPHRRKKTKKKSDREKDFKKHWISASFSCVPFLLLSYWMRNTVTVPQSPGQHGPSVSPVALCCQKMEPMDKHQRLIFTRASREAANLLVFLFCRIAFIFPSSVHIVHLTQAMFSKIVIFFSFSIIRSYLWYKRLRHCMTCFTCMRSSKTAVCLHFHTLFGCIFL